MDQQGIMGPYVDKREEINKKILGTRSEKVKGQQRAIHMELDQGSEEKYVVKENIEKNGKAPGINYITAKLLKAYIEFQQRIEKLSISQLSK